jgi:protein-S-isoprenylcysteine O-methyltransferase Ste14
MQGLELKIPPVALGLVTALLMWLASWIVPALGFRFEGRPVLAICLAIAGALISGSGVVLFRQAQTTVNPMKPESSSSLVQSGIYKWTRNPMYLGFFLVLVAWAFYLSNALAFLILPVFIAYMNRFQIEPEERALKTLFGDEFSEYATRVRRWI